MIRYVIINTLGHNVIELCTVSYISILVKHLQVSLSFYPSGAFRVNYRYPKSQNRLLKVCYVPATSASLPRVNFFFSFLFLVQWPFTVLIKQTRQAVRAVKQSLYS
jgi:hypothetical protein